MLSVHSIFATFQPYSTTETMFKTLGEENINIKVISTSEIKISVLIDRKYLELAVQALHEAFELEKVADQ